MSQDSDLEPVMLSGCLHKEGHKRKSWKLRWFVLEEGHLRYYTNKQSFEPIATICLQGAELTSCKHARRERHAFRLNTGLQADGHSKYILAGANEVESLQWVKALLSQGAGGDPMSISLIPKQGLLRRRTFGHRVRAAFFGTPAADDSAADDEDDDERLYEPKVGQPFAVEGPRSVGVSPKAPSGERGPASGGGVDRACRARARRARRASRIQSAGAVVAGSELEAVKMVWHKNEIGAGLRLSRGKALLVVKYYISSYHVCVVTTTIPALPGTFVFVRFV